MLGLALGLMLADGDALGLLLGLADGEILGLMLALGDSDGEKEGPPAAR